MIGLNEVTEYPEASFCRTDGYYLNVANGMMGNKKFTFNQSYELVYSEADEFYYISNFYIIEDTKFWKFQDEHTYNSFKVAFKNFVKLINANG